MNDPAQGNERSAALRGCVATFASVLVTCVFLFFNASFVMALLKLLEPRFPAWVNQPGAVQFLLFSFPVLLVVVEWMLIDYARGRFRRNYDSPRDS